MPSIAEVLAPVKALVERKRRGGPPPPPLTAAQRRYLEAFDAALARRSGDFAVWLDEFAGELFQREYLLRLGDERVADVDQINNQLYTGGALISEDDVVAIAALGITADVDCRLEFDDYSLIQGFGGLAPTPDSVKTHPAIAYLYAGVPDDGVPKPVSWFEGVWTFAKPILDGGGVVLTHCAAGVNRGPSMAHFLLRAYWKMSDADAFDLLKTHRPVVNVGYRADSNGAIVALGLGGAV